MKEICDCDNRLARLRGVTRVIRLVMTDDEGNAADLTGAELTVRVLLDGSGWSYTVPDIVPTGEEGNILVFSWPADQQPRCGRYTIEVSGDFGAAGIARTDWHGKDGIELVEHSEHVRAANIEALSIEELTLRGIVGPIAGTYYIRPASGIPKTDLSPEVQNLLGAPGGMETDPTVPEWAKAPDKPSYTPEEVGALPADTPIPEAATALTNLEIEDLLGD